MLCCSILFSTANAVSWQYNIGGKMAQIIGPDNHTIHLKQSHLFGRLANAVDTCLNEPAVSRLHFLIEYNASRWYLVDYSRNGTWLNGERIAKYAQIPLKKNDVISIGPQNGIEVKFSEAMAPTDFICQKNSTDSPIEETLPLKSINYFPNQVNCELSIQRENNDWVLEHQQKQRCLKDGDWLTIGGKKWQMVLASMTNCTMELNDAVNLSDLKLQIFTSQDEETTSAKLDSHLGELDLLVRSHHYLLLLLTRQSIKDLEGEKDDTECGWVYIEELMQMLGASETLINIQVHRARKQLEASLESVIDEKRLIERRVGQVRLGFRKFDIYKGGKLETTFDPEHLTPRSRDVTPLQNNVA